MNNKVEVSLRYGDKRINFHLKSKNIITILTANQTMPLKEPLKKLENLLENPTNSLPLEQLIKDKKAGGNRHQKK